MARPVDAHQSKVVLVAKSVPIYFKLSYCRRMWKPHLARPQWRLHFKRTELSVRSLSYRRPMPETTMGFSTVKSRLGGTFTSTLRQLKLFHPDEYGHCQRV